jgi:hypothetical protein
VAVQKAQDGKLHIGVQPEDIERLRLEIRAGERRRNATLAASVLGLGGILWLDPGPVISGLAPLLIIAAIVTYFIGRR